MRITVSEPTETSEWRWVVVCPGITKDANTEINNWLETCGVEYSNIMATYWIRDKRAVEMFLLKWS